MSLALTQIYGSKSVWVTSGSYLNDETVSGSIQQLSRVQGLSYDLQYPLQDQVYLDAGVESYYPTPTSVNATLNWLHTDARNEYFLGLVKVDTNGQAILGLQDEKNLYVAYQDEAGFDAIGTTASKPRTVLGLAQGLLTTYELAGAVGGLIEGRATLNYLTAVIYTGASGLAAPSVSYQDGNQRTGRFVLPVAQSQYSTDPLATGQDVAAIGAQDLIMMFPQNTPFGVVFTGNEACYLQSMQLALSIDRLENKPLGYVYPPNRPIVYPIRVDLTTEAIVARYQADNLSRLTCTLTGQSVNIVVKQPCSNLTMFGFYFNDMQIESQSFSSNIGNTDRVSTKWRGYLKSPSDTFISPFYNYIVRADNSGAWGTTW